MGNGDSEQDEAPADLRASVPPRDAGPAEPDEPARAGWSGGARSPEGAGRRLRAAGRAVARRWRDPRLRWPKRIALGLALTLTVPVISAGIALRLLYAGDYQPGTLTRGRDAAWLGHAWLDGRKDERDLTALARRVRGTGIRDLYVHAGPLEHDGSLPAARYRGSDWFLAAVRRELPGVRVQAWLGDVLATEGPEGLRLTDRHTRRRVVASTRRILDAGFDGVHFDLEPLHSGDRDYLSLLEEVRAITRAREVPLSVAAHMIDPLPSLHEVGGFLTGHPKWWSQAYFGQVARRVDQIAVMSYDTAMPLESLYGGYVARQTTLALEATPRSTDLLMGLPAFHTDDPGHHASAETVRAAVRGVRLGLGRGDPTRQRFGVALYVDYAATDGDWDTYRDNWGCRTGARRA
ncbi:glycoside hydrolase family 18 protein [Streptomyces sp. LX-29]|uniref:hypothetical protein n=1 Tax=Streptomyces sp. LX-29 TaxID=2900152 RepID=UPI00240CEFDD|nr:hypothetical protein [Streptomyces sp. LX-29]WFB06111.1 glycoside hydrolase family 18 protein [Streptomyces sp. LX-29]